MLLRFWKKLIKISWQAIKIFIMIIMSFIMITLVIKKRSCKKGEQIAIFVNYQKHVPIDKQRINQVE